MNNPFLSPNTGCPNAQYTDVEDRINAIKRFSADECRAVLAMADVQKTVRKAAERRLRKLEKERTLNV